MSHSKHDASVDGRFIGALLRELRRRFVWLRVFRWLAWSGAAALFICVAGAAWLTVFGESIWSRGGFWLATLLLLASVLRASIRVFFREPLSDIGISLKLERAFGNLDSQLVSSVQLGRVPGSDGKVATEAFYEALVTDARRRLAEISYQSVLPWGPCRQAGLLLLLALALSGLMQQYFPERIPEAALTLLRFRPNSGVQKLEKWLKASPENVWGVGDIQLEYFFPAYCGLPSRKEINGDGSVKALKGTSIRLRAVSTERLVKGEIRFDSGTSVVLDAGTGERQVTAGFTVLQDDFYQFVGEFPGGKKRASRKFPITVMPDELPTIEWLEGSGDLETDEKGMASFKYLADDDFGVTQVKLLYSHQGERKGDAAIPSATGAPQTPVEPNSQGTSGGGAPAPMYEEQVIAHGKELAQRREGTFDWDLRGLKLAAGEEITFFLRVYDNDTISGPKYVDSAARRIIVKSAQRLREELLASQEKVFEQMAEVLADHLEFPGQLAGATVPEIRTRTLGVSKNIEILVNGIASVIDVMNRNAASAEKNTTGPTEIFKTFAREVSEIAERWKAVKVQDTPALLRLARDADPRFEKMLLTLEQTINTQKAADLLDRSKELLTDFNALDEAMKRLAENPGSESMNEMLKKLQEFEASYDAYMKKMSESMDSIPLEDFVNLDALKQMRRDSVDGQLQRIKKMLQAGDMEGARREMEALRENMKKWEKGATKGGQEKQQALARKLSETMEKLDGAIKGQKKIVESAENLQSRMRKRNESAFNAGYQKFLERQLERLQALDGHLRTFEKELQRKENSKVFLEFENELYREALRHVGLLEKTLKDADLETAEMQVVEMVSLLQRLKGGGEVMFRASGQDEPLAQQRTAAVQKALELARQIMNDLKDRTDSGKPQATNEEKMEMEKLKTAQEGLRKRSLEIADQLEEVSKEAPGFGKDVFGGEEGDKRFPQMREAGGKFAAEDAPGAIPPAREGLFQLQSARDKMNDALKKMQQEGQGGPGGFFLPGYAPAGRAGSDNEKVEIPDADKYQVPQEFRKEIMDAMKKPAPKNFERLNRHYYEELVR